MNRRFYALWCEKGDFNDCEDVKRFKIYYYLIDDTVEIRESPTRFSQNELFKRLLRRTKLPKNYDCGPGKKYIKLNEKKKKGV